MEQKMDVVSSLKKKASEIEKSVEAMIEGQPDILDTLKKEHEEVKSLLGKLVKAEDSATRKKLLKQIKLALVPHARAEEKVVYDRIIGESEKKAKVDGEEGYAEHDLADITLLKLAKITNASSPEFSAQAKVLKELLEHHIDEEERNVWKDIREHCDAEERAAMERKFQTLKKKVKV